MAERTLGVGGKIVTWMVFLFLFYSLMVAYVAASGSLVSDFLAEHLHLDWEKSSGSLFFCLFFGLLLYLGTNAVDWFNRFLMLGLVVAYGCLVLLGFPHVITPT
jgi:tyrosine-specific transport protein